jgi:excisionase family DNA binding protein
MPSPLSVSKSETARLIGVSRPFVEKLINDGTLRCVRLGERTLRIPVCDILAALGLTESAPETKGPAGPSQGTADNQLLDAIVLLPRRDSPALREATSLERWHQCSD